MRIRDRLKIIGWNVLLNFSILLIIIFFISMIFGVVRCSYEIEEKGLKSMFLEIWEGSQDER